MKILFAGGGTGGHFYPIIAIAEELLHIADEEKLVDLELYYLAPTPYDVDSLFKHNIIYKRIPAGKLRNYFSLLNFFDFFRTGIGIIKAVIDIYFIFPDVIVGKGGYTSFPVLLAGRLFRIPIIIHESDSVAGKVNRWAGKFATRIAISYPEAAQYFPEDKVALTGNPIRKEIASPAPSGAHEYLGLEEGVQTLLILGGSQGAQHINEVIVDSLPRLVSSYQIIHQTGLSHIDEVKQLASVTLKDTFAKGRYHPFEYLNTTAMRMAAGAADLVISRAGSAIFEIAAWEKPSILIPISEKVAHDQRENAFTYARSGAAVVIEDNNLTKNILVPEIEKIMSDSVLQEKMKKSAREFARHDAARTIAREIIQIALSHEKTN
ncbi:MAG: undecaprenyldiphospho-muramoylpentapeptide beta-N-acetylglucosaminyltransferase [Candidatus Lloydbacteria bacterium CG22_combo_CG10-13_8_21_14_all_47_15]|uniref:UDP-N-acetylglucosamine--N-acetylmuramyl-(pentapeptide) pyrophosphoryl-undecaprenol N-acetylglucosamine transferase n=1 Tax=Candidatus Lloydbacteria bacterium CG22_combo_CG10-13_8_21_14_all_47_15 TaxID=1974635 RepID=A0A2H0CVV4_9BACT|nr:MAG: undecaprenyldiphospho-muramoylpentapeptide beta-N-acetylglucosaminyltransferase [Candidatus Lloydbacteria bacterium CG22_combo_CG10-13_8_21_14_all_47_15]